MKQIENDWGVQSPRRLAREENYLSALKKQGTKLSSCTISRVNQDRMSSAVAKASKYTYRSTGGGTADVSIEYSADLSALSRLEVG